MGGGLLERGGGSGTLIGSATDSLGETGLLRKSRFLYLIFLSYLLFCGDKYWGDGGR